jgi:hypothetical protein
MLVMGVTICSLTEKQPLAKWSAAAVFDFV